MWTLWPTPSSSPARWWPSRPRPARRGRHRSPRGRLSRAGYRTVRRAVSPRPRQPAGLPGAARPGVLDPLDCVPPYVPLSEDEEAIRGRGAATPRASPPRWWRPRSGSRPGASGGSACCSSWARRRLGRRARRRRARAPRPLPDQRRAHREPALHRAEGLAPGGPPGHRPRRPLGLSGRRRSAVAALLDTIERIRRLPLPADPLLGSVDAQRRAHPGRGRPQRAGAGGERADPDPHRRAHRRSSRPRIRALAAPGVSVGVSGRAAAVIRPAPRRPGGRPPW